MRCFGFLCSKVSVVGSRLRAAHLVYGPVGHEAGLHARHPGEELTVLLPAQRQVPAGVGRHRREEDRLVEGLLQTVCITLP